VSEALELVLKADCELGESPVWLADQKMLAFVDITGRRIHRYDPVSGAHRIDPVDEDIGCIAPAVGGGFIAGMRSGLWLLDDAGQKVRELAGNPEPASTNRFNDGKVDPAGRYYAGTVDEPKSGGTAGLYRYDRRGLAKLTNGLTTSNGAAFSPDGKTLYHSDTPRFTIWRWDYDPATGEAANQREFVRLDPAAPDRARPDGASVDAEGGYWSALYGGARLHRYDPRGRLIATYPLPAARVTMPAFGGDGLKTLFVTTAADGDKEGGGLYACEPGVAGLPIPAFDPSV
jgi:sugar lactone lactonase YvrE